MTADNLLSPIVTSHCFFGCGRTVTDRPDAAHDGCTATGTTNASAEKHTNEQRHVTTTEVRA